MTDIATRARESAYHFEAKKTGFGQAQDGWSITFRVQHADMPAAVKDALKGTRYQLALVEILDNEEPKPKEVTIQYGQIEAAVTETTQPPPSTVLRIKTGEAERRDWDTLPYSQRAGIRCEEPIFRAFLREMCGKPLAVTAAGAAIVIRELCEVESRGDIRKGTEAEKKWLEIEDWFAAWKTKERAMA